MLNGLDLAPATMSCPSTTLCVFTGGTPSTPGHFEQGISVSTGPFTPGGKIIGQLTAFAGTNSESYVSCPSTTLCVLSTETSLYATVTPVTGPWTLELAAQPQGVLAGVSCASVTFCAVATHVGNVLIATDPLGGAGAWVSTDVTKGSADLFTISCPSPRFCVAGGSYGEIGGWIATSTDPGGGSGAWSGGALTTPAFAQHSGEYAVTGLSCPTTAFCLASGGELLVSTDPGGPHDLATRPSYTSFPRGGLL